MASLPSFVAMLHALLVVAILNASYVFAQTVTAPAGVIQGTTTSISAASAVVSQFLGIPFAVTPPQRFSPAVAAKQFQGAHSAKSYQPACIQAFPYTSQSERQFIEDVFDTPVPKESEDCLYLNIFVPSSPPPQGGFSVMFWIYGGSNNFGNAGQPEYDGSYLSAFENVIIVTANYRTNVFGFPASPALPLTGLNLGLLDQRLALAWVQKNIKAFGGSPGKVTIFGESAGAEDIDALLTSYGPNSVPPFRAAILESGQASYRPFEFGNNTPSWDTLSSALKCPGSPPKSQLACVRAADAPAIRSVINNQGLPFGPVVDGLTLMASPAALRRNNKTAPVPVMAGTNSQEGRVFAAAAGINNNTQLFDFLFGPLANNNSFVGALESTFAALVGPFTNATFDTYSQIITDFIFTCPCKDWIGEYATDGLGVPAWRYLFNASFPNTQPNTQPKQNLGVYHSSEIPIVFGTFPRSSATTQEKALSRSMMKAWANFAKDPSAGPGWEQASTQNDQTLAVFGDIGNQVTSSYKVIGSGGIDQYCGLYEWIYALNP